MLIFNNAAISCVLIEQGLWSMRHVWDQEALKIDNVIVKQQTVKNGLHSLRP